MLWIRESCEVASVYTTVILLFGIFILENGHRTVSGFELSIFATLASEGLLSFSGSIRNSDRVPFV